MSTVTIQRKFRVAGVLTDMTGDVLLTDAGATYGIKNTATDVVVVAAGTAMTHASTGIYTYSLTATAGTYTYSMKYVYDGDTYYTTSSVVVPATSPVVDTTWHASSGMWTPKSLYDHLCYIFGADATGATKRASVVSKIMDAAGGFVWNLSGWQFEHLTLDLTTVANQDYTELPSDYRRIPSFGHWLVGSSDSDDRPSYVHPSRFRTLEAQLSDRGQSSMPEIFTLGHKLVGSEYTPVVYWAGTPTSAKTYKGFQYFRKWPGIDVTDDDTETFPDVELDMLWEMTAVRWLSSRIKEIEVNPPTLTEWKEAIEDAKTNLEYTPPSSMPNDVNRDSDDIAFLGSSVGEDYDTDGHLLLGGD